MSVLTLVRHAQASFFADDYDCLSPIGEVQAHRLGEFWVERGEVFSEVYVGPRRRQQQTAALVRATYDEAGRPWPEPIVLQDLDEYDLVGLLRTLAPALAQQDPDFAKLVETHRDSQVERERARSFQRMFERLLTHWQGTPALGEIDALESWSAFRDRVGRGLERMTEGPARSRNVAAFTSGGFVGTAVARSLGAPEQTALELSWRLRNGALTHLLFTPERLTLDAFNTSPHLTDPDHWTYR